MKPRRLAFAAAVTHALAAAPAGAEPVYVDTGSAGGQGWAFNRGGSCLVATAAHVVRDSQEGSVYGRGGIKGVFNRVTRHPDPEVDVALLWIEGGPLKDRCPASSLGYDDSRPNLARLKTRNGQLLVQVVEPTGNADAVGSGEIRSIPVQVDTFDPGSDGHTFVFVPARPDLQPLGTGDSGAAILDPGDGGTGPGQPLGMVIQEGGVGTAVLFDRIKALVRALERAGSASPSPSRPGPRASVTLADWNGHLLNPRCGPLSALEGEGCTFSAEPLPGQPLLEIDLALPPAATVREVRIRFSQPPSNGVGIAAKASADQRDWAPIRFCRPTGLDLSCGLGGLRATRLRLSFRGRIHVTHIEAH